MLVPEQPNLTKVLKVKVGGVAGLGASEATSVITLEKQRFAPGENIRVDIQMDNLSCKKAVKSYKCKLQRKISCLAGKVDKNNKALLTVDEYLHMAKFDGCAEKVRDSRTIEFQVPMVDPARSTVDSLHPELREMVKMLAGTIDTTLFKIDYVLDVYVKHQSKLEFGMGNFVSFKIDVKHNEVDLPFVAAKDAAWLESQNISVWSPQQSYPQVDVYLQLNANQTYTPISTWNGGVVSQVQSHGSSIQVDQTAMNNLNQK